MTFPALGIPVLSLLILALVISAYLATLREPQVSTRYLLTFFVALTLYAATLLGTTFVNSALLNVGIGVFGLMMLWAVVQFCYTFLEQPFGREYHVAWSISLAATAAALVFGIAYGEPWLMLLTTAMMIVLSVWASIVVVRKVWLVTRRDEPSVSRLRALLHPPTRSGRAFRAVLLPVVVAVSIMVVYLLMLGGVVPGEFYRAWLRLGLLLAPVLVAMIQFTYGVERHTVQIKLVGTALVIVLAVLGIVSMIVIEPVEGSGHSVLAARMAIVIVAASIVTVVAFPLAFRASLLQSVDRLLAGIRRVNDGQLDVVVPVTVPDEIGELTASFNGMTATLQQYATRMEALVAERTADLEQSQARLVQQEKLASLGALTAGIAHEIRNPLNFVNNFAQLGAELAQELRTTLPLEATSDDVEELLADLEHNAEKVVEHGKRADGIVRSMLMHSRGGRSEREPTDVNALAREYAHLAFHGMRAQDSGFNCELDLDLADDVPLVDAVPQDIGRVLLNIINNAFHAASSGGNTNGQHAPRVRVASTSTADGVEVRVSDSGPGIPPAVQERIFEPFFTTKPTGEGTGLGLSMSHEIVVQGHGGELLVESPEGAGATFIVRLPAATEHEIAP